MKEGSSGKPSAAGFGRRLSYCVNEALPGAMKTIWWVVRITAVVSVVIYVLRLTGALPWLSRSLSPVMSFIGLPGEASLAYVSGYFVNVYSAIAACASLNLSARSITILAVLVLCSHNMIVETAVQKKTGSSVLRIVLVRTLSGLGLAFILNKILPFEAQGSIGQVVQENLTLEDSLLPWALSLLKLCLFLFVFLTQHPEPPIGYLAAYTRFVQVLYQAVQLIKAFLVRFQFARDVGYFIIPSGVVGIQNMLPESILILKQPGTTARANVNRNIVRRIITRQTLDPDKTYYLKIKSVLDTETAEFYMDHIEYCPKEIYDNPVTPEDIW